MLFEITHKVQIKSSETRSLPRMIHTTEALHLNSRLGLRYVSDSIWITFKGTAGCHFLQPPVGLPAMLLSSLLMEKKKSLCNFFFLNSNADSHIWLIAGGYERTFCEFLRGTALPIEIYVQVRSRPPM